MIPLAYSYTLELQNSFRIIESLREKLLALNISSQREKARHFRCTIESIYCAHDIAMVPIEYDNIEKQLRTTHIHSRYSTITAYADLMHEIELTWAGRPELISLTNISAIHKSMSGSAYATHTSFWDQFNAELGTILTYIRSREEHPIIQAAIVNALYIAATPWNSALSMAGSLASRAILTSYGFTCRGLLSPERAIAINRTSLKHASDSIRLQSNLNHWILYTTQSLESELNNTIEELSLKPTSAVQEYSLNTRQKGILRSLLDPSAYVSNAHIQRHYGVSPVTAARDLQKLTTLGLIFKRGSGRSTTYSKA